MDALEIEGIEPSQQADSWSVRRIWGAVILQAISDHYSPNIIESDKISATKYLFGGTKELNGFVHLCFLFDLDANNLRRSLLKYKDFQAFKNAMHNTTQPRRRK